MPTDAPVINVPALRTVRPDQVITINGAQLAVLLDAYEAQQDPVAAPEVVAGSYARIHLPVIVDRKVAPRLRQHRGPVFAYTDLEIAEASGVDIAVVRKAIKAGTVRPGVLLDVFTLQARIQRDATVKPKPRARTA
jgi:hypothetical protein